MTNVQQNANRPRELIPDNAFEPAGTIQFHQTRQKRLKPRGFGQAVFSGFVGIGRIECHPQENEAPVIVFAALRPIKPAQDPEDPAS